jgi:hypothetical protein
MMVSVRISEMSALHPLLPLVTIPHFHKTASVSCWLEDDSKTGDPLEDREIS